MPPQIKSLLICLVIVVWTGGCTDSFQAAARLELQAPGDALSKTERCLLQIRDPRGMPIEGLSPQSLRCSDSESELTLVFTHTKLFSATPKIAVRILVQLMRSTGDEVLAQGSAQVLLEQGNVVEQKVVMTTDPRRGTDAKLFLHDADAAEGQALGRHQATLHWSELPPSGYRYHLWRRDGTGLHWAGELARTGDFALALTHTQRPTTEHWLVTAEAIDGEARPSAPMGWLFLQAEGPVMRPDPNNPSSPIYSERLDFHVVPPGVTL
ncbi:MAG: hypothetical protein R3C68_01395 [Myxococcota bacterium]